MADPLTREDLLELFERVTPPEFHAALKDHPSYALIRGLAQLFARVATQGSRSQQSAFLLPNALQQSAPASSFTTASGSVTLRREGDSTSDLRAEAGEIRVEGRGGRFYRNATAVQWFANSPAGQTQTATFVCEVAGTAGNLDHVADDSGLLPLDRIAIADQSQERANVGASVLLEDSGVVLQDSGVPDLFGPDDVGLYVRINQAANPENVGRRVKITGFDFPATEDPPGSGLYPRRVFVGSTELSVPREAARVDAVPGITAPEGSITDPGAVLPFFPDPVGVNDALLVFSAYPLAGLDFTAVTPADIDGTITWEYWNGTAWTALSGVTGNSDLALSGAQQVQWDVPTDFALLTSPLGTPWYAVRARLSALTTATTLPTFQAMFTRDSRPLTPESGTVTWALEDWADRGLVVHEAEAFTGGADDNLRLIGDSRGLYQQADETDDTYRVRVSQLLDTVSPNAILRAVNRQLRPFGFEGRAIDVSNGLTGAFFNQDPFDHYTAGEVGHSSARAVATSNQSLSGLPVVDGVTLAAGEVLLVTGQTLAIENGAYIVDGAAWTRDPNWGFGPGSNALSWTTLVTEGTTYAGTTWVVNAGDVIATDGLVIDQFAVDLFPEDKKVLALSLDEAHGFFLVEVPYLGEDETGVFFDDGPTQFLDSAGVYLAGFFGSGFFDGTSLAGDAAYNAIYSTVREIAAAGICFALSRDQEINLQALC